MTHMNVIVGEHGGGESRGWGSRKLMGNSNRDGGATMGWKLGLQSYVAQ